METESRREPSTVVGHASFTLVDASRRERFDRKYHRHVEVMVWYPASQSEPAASASVRTSQMNLPLSDARDRYPVLLFSHDIATCPSQYDVWMQRLAEEGYVIFSINHPYLSKRCQVSTGEMKRSKIISFRKRLHWQWMFASRALKSVRRAANDEQRWTATREVMGTFDALRPVHNDMAIDRAFLLDFLAQINVTLLPEHTPYKLFSGRLDLDKIGAFGHGWGGSSAVQSLVQDRRVRAAINLDGFQFSPALMEPIVKPLMMIYAAGNCAMNKALYFGSDALDSYTVHSSRHSSFCAPEPVDQPILPVDEAALYDALTVTLHFFERYVKGLEHLYAKQAAML